MDRNLKRTCVAHIQRLLICTCIFTFFATIGKASHVQENTEAGNYILILNSYNEILPLEQQHHHPHRSQNSRNREHGRLHRASESFYGRRFH